MIISDKHKFCFIHIPKCAGSTVGACLSKYDSCKPRFFEQFIRLGDLGRVDAGHMTLRSIQEYFPKEYRKIATYDSFAVARDPFHRFPSSLYQHLAFYGDKPVREMTRAEFLAGLESAINYLELGHDILDNEHVHFQRQSDYVYRGQTKVIKTLYTPGTLQLMLDEISSLTGDQIILPNRMGESLAYKPGLAGKLARSLTFVYRSPFGIMAPSSLVNFAKRRLMRRPADFLADILESRDVKSFIAEYYKEDIALYQMTRSRHNKSSERNQ